MSGRAMEVRKASPGIGLVDAQYPLAEFVRGLPHARRIGQLLWSRLTDEEDLRDVARRVRRQLGPEAIPGSDRRRDEELQHVDMVMMVAGILWPGLKAWRELRPRDGIMADVWWGTWGARPGAAIFRDGVLHLVGMDSDAPNLLASVWAKWASLNWRGPVLYHGIQEVGRELVETSALVETLAKHANGAHQGCVLWTTTGYDARPWRADISGGKVLIQHLGDTFKVASRGTKGFEIKSEWPRITEFWTWLRELQAPAEELARMPKIQYLEPALMDTATRVKQGSKKRTPPPPDQVPLLEEAVDPQTPAKSLAEAEFGERPTANLPIERLAAMLELAKRNKKRAMLSLNRRQEAHWTQVLNEVEAAMSEKAPAPRAQ